MSRERLTRRAADGSIPYPGMVGNEDRQFKKMDEYSNFKQEVNHELPDNRTEWKDNPRDEIGFGEAKEQTGVSDKLKHTVAGVRQAASKAVKLAVLLLGEKADESTLETQARAFMAMGPEELDATLDRFASTEHLYVANGEEDEDEDKEEKEEKEASEVVAEDKEEDEKEVSAADKLADLQSQIATLQSSFEKKAEEEEEEKEVIESSDKIAELEAQLASFKEFAAKGAIPPQFLENIKEKKDDKKDEKESSEVIADKVIAEEVSAGKIDPEMDEESDNDDDKIGSVESGLDVELNSVVADYENAPESEATLASIFDDNTPSQDDLNKLASSKEGIKSLGGQPKVASSADAEKNIGSIWDDAPDVSSVFQ